MHPGAISQAMCGEGMLTSTSCTVCAGALRARRARAHNFAIDVLGVVWVDVTGATAAV
jgi:hypothetical protein